MTNQLRAVGAMRMLSAVILVALVAALTIDLSAGPPVPTPAAAGSGVGTITLDGTSVTTSGLTQTLGNAQGCVLSTSGADVLRFDGDGKPVGLVDGSIGVKSKGNGQDCGQVDGAEKLVVELGAAVTGGSSPSAIGTAVLDVEVLQDAAVTVTTYFVDGPKAVETGVFTLGTGVNAAAGAGNTPQSTTTSPAASCNPASSSGPNAADADNCYWTIIADTPFNRFQIETGGGKVSLQGGGDWPAGSVGGPTVLHLVDAPDGILACGDTRFAGDSELGGVITRLGDADTDPDCELKPYQFQVDGERVEFEPEGDAARYSAGITKQVPAGQPVDGDDWIEIDVDGDGPGPFVDMEWCLSATVTDSLVGGEVHRLVETATLPTGEIWCVAAVDVGDPIPTGNVTATFWLYGIDDPHWK